MSKLHIKFNNKKTFCGRTIISATNYNIIDFAYLDKKNLIWLEKHKDDVCQKCFTEYEQDCYNEGIRLR